jgi:phage tail sheath protein FI
MAKINTPGICIQEKNSFPNSMVEVATSVPAFIGYTEKIDSNNRSILNKPYRICSLEEFHTLFVQVSLTRPSEFTTLQFKHQMQESS